MADGWKAKAKAEIAEINSTWVERYVWQPHARASDEWIDLFVHFTRRAHGQDGRSPDRYLLRLRYAADFVTAGRREAFVDPGDLDDASTEFWPAGIRGILPTNNPPAICLEGTYGFHSHLHRDRDPRAAQLNKLLMEIQRVMEG